MSVDAVDTGPGMLRDQHPKVWLRAETVGDIKAGKYPLTTLVDGCLVDQRGFTYRLTNDPTLVYPCDGTLPYLGYPADLVIPAAPAPSTTEE